MAGRVLIFSFALVFLGGCAAAPLPPIAATHPGNPDAREASPPPPSTALRNEPTDKVPASSSYTCPMHPEVHAMKPGQCPKCGMALVPEATGHSMTGGGHAH